MPVKQVCQRWVKLLRLSWTELGLLFEALLLLPFMALALRWVSFKRCQSVLARAAPLRDMPVEGQAESLLPRASSAAKMVRAAAWYGPWCANCLHQSLTLWWLLRRRGIGSDLKIGVRKTTGQFEAHAWVELAGAAINDTAEVTQRFSAFDRAIRAAGVTL
jgi:hypothetical protein